MTSNEPSDAVRVVNALLTQLDALKRFPNALVLTTSNIASAVDPAFVDRADIKQYVGPPGVVARYSILGSCIAELQRSGALAPAAPLLLWPALQHLLPHQPVGFDVLLHLTDGGLSPAPRHSLMLHALATACAGLSGRALRKLPFIADALFLTPAEGAAAEMPAFLQALKCAIEHEHLSRSRLEV
jgi:SpoVK/Ycf46/Vps4 family AAA+-type ATPase